MTFRFIIRIICFAFLVETNYQIAYYFADGLYVVCCLVILVFLKIEVEKTEATVMYAFKRVLNPATGVFLVILLGNGIGYGIYLNYVVVYLQENLEASSAMVGKYFSWCTTL